jgi:amino acid adenylation domain-containing protein/non-ribosomal peptide synthase protein (TIGR01720 family)
MRFIYFNLGEERPARLLIVCHHLVIDGVSWRILLEDLQLACSKLAAAENPRLPTKTTSFQHWAETLKDYSSSEAVLAEADYWLDASRRTAFGLPRDYTDGDNSVGSTQAINVSLSAEETQALLQEVPAVYHTQISDVLLTALALALSKWMGSGRVLIDMEGHGREQVSPRVDVSRTVGWFTSIYPVLLEVGGQGGGVREEQVGEVLKRVKEQLREIPEQGIGYGLLRYMSGNQQVRAELERMPQAEVIFNYLGQVDRVLGESGAFGVAPEFGGSQRSSQGIREHLLEINSMVAAGRLQLSWTYSQHVHRRESIEEIAAQYIKALQQIIHHCQSEGAGGYTPSDFPLAQLMQAQLDRVMAERRGVEDLYRLSPMQQGMLFHSLYAPHSGLYFEQALNRFEGQFDVEGLKYAWEQVIERHEVLRSSYQWEGVSWPVQIVHAEVAGQWMEEDWRELATTAQQERLESFLIADRRSGFDLTRPPLMRLALLRLGDEVWEVVWSFHHILLDGWCMSLLMKEVFGYYEAYTRGEELEIARPRPYRDYIGWLQGQDMEEAEAYWRSRLAGFTSPTPLGIGAQANSLHTSSSTYAEQQTHLSVEATSELEALARQQQVTLNTVVQGAWALLLSRYSQEQDVLFGATVSGRPPQLAGVEEMVGLFINSLPVRVLVREEARLGEWLQQLQAEQSEMRQYEYSPLVEVQGWSEVERGVALFESLLAYENYPVEPMVAGASETVGRVRYEQVWSMERTNYPLTIVVGPGRRLLIKVLYEEERLEGEGIERLLGHIERLLESMTEGAGQRLSELRMMREEEEEQILVEWNRTATEYPRHLCIHQLFERQAALTPDATAVVYQDERLTYSELNGRSNQLAHYLRAQGVVEESLVGLCLERSALMVTALLGILKAGGAYLPLDPAYPPSRLSFMLHDAGASFLLTHHLAAEHLAAPLIQAISLERVRDQLSQHSTANLHQELCSENLAYVIYTSGSTGTPKGVAVTHRGVVRLVHNTNYISIGPDDVLLHLAPLSFDASTFEVWGALLNGARLVVPVAGQLSLAEIGAAIESHQVSTLWLTAGLFHLMVAEQLEELAQVRQVLAGGDVLSARDVRRVVESGGEGVLINGYGPTENTTFSCCHVMRRGGGEFRGGSVPIGRAVSNTRVYVVDEGMAVVPVGVSGELLVGGDGLARGYLHRAEMTAERFIPDPFSEGGGERLYRTGDVVRWGEGGELEFMGRQDEQVKVRGYRVETGEVEAVLQSHAAVRESVVIAQAEGGAGSGAESGAESGAGSGGESGGGKRLIGYVVLEEGLEVSVGELGEYLRERLPEFMVPGEIVELEEMPLSANGKVDRRALVERAAQRGVEGEGYVGPRTPVEEILSNIWAEVLGVKRVGIHDNFFELGGHSLKATQIVSRVRDIFKVHLPLRRLFEEALTVAELAELTEEAKDQIVEAQEPSIVPISRDAYRTNRSSLRIDNNSYGD